MQNNTYSSKFFTSFFKYFIFYLLTMKNFFLMCTSIWNTCFPVEDSVLIYIMFGSGVVVFLFIIIFTQIKVLNLINKGRLFISRKIPLVFTIIIILLCLLSVLLLSNHFYTSISFLFFISFLSFFLVMVSKGTVKSEFLGLSVLKFLLDVPTSLLLGVFSVVGFYLKFDMINPIGYFFSSHILVFLFILSFYCLLFPFGFWIYWGMESDNFVSCNLHTCGLVSVGAFLFYGLSMHGCLNSFWVMVIVSGLSIVSFLLFIIMFMVGSNLKKSSGFLSASNVCFFFLLLILCPNLGIIYFILVVIMKNVLFCIIHQSKERISINSRLLILFLLLFILFSISYFIFPKLIESQGLYYSEYCQLLENFYRFSFLKDVVYIILSLEFLGIILFIIRLICYGERKFIFTDYRLKLIWFLIFSLLLCLIQVFIFIFFIGIKPHLFYFLIILILIIVFIFLPCFIFSEKVLKFEELFRAKVVTILSMVWSLLFYGQYSSFKIIKVINKIFSIKLWRFSLGGLMLFVLFFIGLLYYLYYAYYFFHIYEVSLSNNNRFMTSVFGYPIELFPMISPEQFTGMYLDLKALYGSGIAKEMVSSYKDVLLGATTDLEWYCYWEGVYAIHNGLFFDVCLEYLGVDVSKISILTSIVCMGFLRRFIFKQFFMDCIKGYFNKEMASRYRWYYLFNFFRNYNALNLSNEVLRDMRISRKDMEQYITYGVGHDFLSNLVTFIGRGMFWVLDYSSMEFLSKTVIPMVFNLKGNSLKNWENNILVRNNFPVCSVLSDLRLIELLSGDFGVTDFSEIFDGRFGTLGGRDFGSKYILFWTIRYFRQHLSKNYPSYNDMFDEIVSFYDKSLRENLGERWDATIYPMGRFYYGGTIYAALRDLLIFTDDDLGSYDNCFRAILSDSVIGEYEKAQIPMMREDGAINSRQLLTSMFIRLPKCLPLFEDVMSPFTREDLEALSKTQVEQSIDLTGIVPRMRLSFTFVMGAKETSPDRAKEIEEIVRYRRQLKENLLQRKVEEVSSTCYEDNITKQVISKEKRILVKDEEYTSPTGTSVKVYSFKNKS